MNDLIIRPLKRTDAEVISFAVERLSSLWKVPSEEILNEFIKPSFNGDFPYFFIALMNGKFAGKIILSIEKDWFLGIDGQPWISAVFVPEKYRSQGIARKLIKQCEDIACQRGYSKLYLDTVNGTGYYQKIGGWVELGNDTYKGEEVTVMVKYL